MSTATTGFAGALEECARVKGAGESGEQLLAASGLQYMISSSSAVLSDTLYRSFEIPLLHAFDTYVATLASRHAEYETLLAEKTAAIRQTEADNLKQGRKKSRDLSQFRRALERLQEQVKEVEVCKGSYYGETLDGEVEMWEIIGGKVALLLRSTLDLADRLASKATSDPVIEGMLNEHPDPFDSYRLETEEDRDVFTILPPLGMNLGLGGSKRGSVIDLDKEVARTAEGNLSPGPTTPRPRKAVSVGNVLGLHVDTAPAPSHDEPDWHDQPRTSSPPASSGSDESSPPPPTSTIDDPPSPTRPSTSLPALLTTLTLETPRKTLRRPLSRVSESEPSDPMAGDWDAPVYGKTLSPVMNGNGGDGWESPLEEEEVGTRRRRRRAE